MEDSGNHAKHSRDEREQHAGRGSDGSFARHRQLFPSVIGVTTLGQGLPVSGVRLGHRNLPFEVHNL